MNSYDRLTGKFKFHHFALVCSIITIIINIDIVIREAATQIVSITENER